MSRGKDFERALKFASRLHAKQTRKGSDAPYISHLLAVAAIALEHGATEKEAIAALMHDAVEDQGGQKTLDEIRRRYGVLRYRSIAETALARTERGVHRAAAVRAVLGAAGGRG